MTPSVCFKISVIIRSAGSILNDPIALDCSGFMAESSLEMISFFASFSLPNDGPLELS